MGEVGDNTLMRETAKPTMEPPRWNRKEVGEVHDISVFDADSIEVLMDWRI